MSKGSAPPWHLWGSIQILQVLGGTQQTLSPQMSQIRYARPESWRFFFQIKILNVVGVNAGTPNYVINYDLSFGVGRAMTRIASFAQFVIAPASFVPNFTAHLTSVQFPAENPTRTAPNLMDHFPAQAIQCSANGQFDAVDVNNTVGAGTQIEVLSFFAPDPHIRPEWHLHEFPGDEHKGT